MSALQERCHIRRALLVEGHEVIRSVTTGQLRDAGVELVVAVSRIATAREHLEREHFDLVMCSQEFDGKAESGHDLLDELRRTNLLAPDTVFVMVAASATYQDVAEAGEASIDTFLVRPFTTEALTTRLREAVHRRRALSPIFSALDEGQPGMAFTRALLRFQQGQRYAIYCGRLAAEMLLRFQRPDDAERIFQRIADRRPLDWAYLGIARAQSAIGDLKSARASIERIQQRMPDSADAHELMGQVLIEHGELQAALAHCQRAAALTPGCVIRSQIAATLAFYVDTPAQALPLLVHSCRLGHRSRLFNPLVWVLLALARLQTGDTKGLMAAAQGLTRWSERNPEDPRNTRWQRAMDVLQAWGRRAHETAVEQTRQLGLLADESAFDLEAANVLLSLWSLLPADRWPETERRGLAQTIGLRLGVSKSVTELMCSAARDQPLVVAALRQAQHTVSQYAQRGVQRAQGAGVTPAVTQLLELAETTRNARLYELVGLTLKRHAASVTSPEVLQDLTERAARGLLTHAQSVSHIAGVQRPGRSAAGLPLRGWNHEASVKALLPSLEAVDAAMQQQGLVGAAVDATVAG